LQRATAAAGLAVEKFGAMASIPNAQDVFQKERAEEPNFVRHHRKEAAGSMIQLCEALKTTKRPLEIRDFVEVGVKEIGQ
jgi:hypothetical protein